MPFHRLAYRWRELPIVPFITCGYFRFVRWTGKQFGNSKKPYEHLLCWRTVGVSSRRYSHDFRLRAPCNGSEPC